MLRSILKREKGFTLVELLVVVVIIGILVAIAIPVYSMMNERAEESACFANQRNIEEAARMYHSINNDWPGGLGDLVDNDFLTHEPECPSEGTYTLSDGEVSCSESDH